MSVTAAIVQARAGSTRLPGKVLKELGGMTVLAQVLRRCLAIEGADVVCCATTEAAEDDAVAREAARLGVEVFRGSADDVLDRYYRAARALDAGVVLRVTADCPLIDPRVGAAVLRLRAEAGVDFAANNLPPSWPLGLDCEGFTMAALTRAAEAAKAPREREHVSPWMQTSPAITRGNLEGPGGALAGQRWTLDYPEDYAFLKALFDRLGAGAAIPGMAEAAALIESDPGIEALQQACRRPLEDIPFGDLAFSAPMEPTRLHRRLRRRQLPCA